MSEVQKPVEETVAPVEATPAVEPASEAKAEETTTPAVAETPAAEADKDAVETAPATEMAVAEKTAPKKEFTGEGILGYKAPGGFIKKLAGFQKKYFWFGEEPIHSKDLSSYLRGEKPEIANHNSAWSMQTGKGLLYFSKTSSEKATPAGIINLADISDVTNDGTVDFYFVAHGAKHVFQTSTLNERDSWVAAIKAKAADAKGMAEEIKNSDSYKEHLSSLSKPTLATPAVVAAAPKDSETKKEEKAEAKEEKKEEKATRKSRSASRKRNSIFGNFGLGSKKEETTEAKEVGSAEPAVTEPAPLDGPAVAEAAVAAPVVEEPAKTEEVTPVAAETARPANNKRNSSIFGTLSSKFGQKKSTDRKVSSEAPAVPAKDVAVTEPVSDEAPVIPAPEASEPLSTAVETPATAPVTETTNGVKTEEAKAETKPETKSEKRKSSLPFGLGAPKKETPESDGEKPKSPFAKFRQTIKGKTSSKPTEKTAEKPVEKSEENAAGSTAEAPATTSDEPAAEIATEPVVSEPVSAHHQPTPTVTATA